MPESREHVDRDAPTLALHAGIGVEPARDARPHNRDVHVELSGRSVCDDVAIRGERIRALPARLSRGRGA